MDLCNDQRPRQCEYGIEEGEDGEVEVVLRARRDVGEGEEVTYSYGALGGARTLVDYGFVVETVREPDGSCNEVVEIEMGGTWVGLRGKGGGEDTLTGD